MSSVMVESNSDSEDEQSPLLLSSLVPGAKCVVAADAAAVILCRRRQPICCLRSSLELFSIPDGSVVEVLQPNVRQFGARRSEHLVGVRVLTSLDAELNGVLGSISTRWLHAYGDFLSSIRSQAKMRSPSYHNLQHSHQQQPQQRSLETVADASPERNHPIGDDAERHEPDPNLTDRDDHNADQDESTAAHDLLLTRIGIDPQTNPITPAMVLSKLALGQYEFDGDLIGSMAEAMLGSLGAGVDIAQVRTTGQGQITIILRQRQIVTLTTPIGFVLDGAKLMPRPVQTRRLALRDRIEVTLAPGGRLASVRTGDIGVVKGPITIGVKIRMEICPGRVDTDDRGRAIVEMDANGNPVRDAEGNYRVRRYDDWIVISALGRTHWIGLGQFDRRRQSIADQ